MIQDLKQQNSIINSLLQRTLDSVPDDIRTWFGSSRVANEIIKLNKKFEIPENKIGVLPRTILRLQVKDILPQDFSKEIFSNLGTGQSSANTIVEEIIESILKPIADPLRNWGVEINLIKPIEAELPARQIIAPPPPPPPQIAYEPPPPPAMGGMANIGATSDAPTEGGVGKGSIHIIGDAHVHSAGEKQMPDDESESVIEKERGGIAGLRPPSQILAGKTWEGKKIKLPVPSWQAETSEEGEETPFILHKETSFTPVAKEQEWRPPVRSAPPAPTIPTPPITPPPANVKNIPSKIFPKSNLESSAGEKPAIATSAPKLRVVHYDEEELMPVTGASQVPKPASVFGPSKPAAAMPAPQHNANQKLIKPPAVSPLRSTAPSPQKNAPASVESRNGAARPKTGEGPNIKGNTVDLR